MSLQISITVKGDQEIQAKLRRLGDSITHLRASMIIIGREAAEYYSTTGFANRGRPWGEAWPDLKPATKRYKQKHWAGKPALIRTGDMQKGFYAEAGNTSVTIGNRVEYYKYHQSSSPRTKIPRRQMAGINNPIKTIAKNAIQAEIKSKIARA